MQYFNSVCTISVIDPGTLEKIFRSERLEVVGNNGPIVPGGNQGEARGLPCCDTALQPEDETGCLPSGLKGAGCSGTPGLLTLRFQVKPVEDSALLWHLGLQCFSLLE